MKETKKPIIATTLSGLFTKREPWKKAHLLWFKKAAEELKDKNIEKYALEKDYFKYVDIVMQKIYPNMDDEERTKKAREMFFNSVLQYINENPEVKNKEAIDYFSQIKEKFSVALITTNTLQVTNKILSLIDAPDLFDIIETSNLDEKDDKSLVFDRFLKKHGKPRLYIGGDRKDSFDYCKEHDIPSVFANLENQEEIQNVESAHSLDELKIKIESLIRNNA